MHQGASDFRELWIKNCASRKGSGASGVEAPLFMQVYGELVVDDFGFFDHVGFGILFEYLDVVLT